MPAPDIAEKAHGWASVNTWNDPGVSLYAFASTGGCVQSEAHRADCLHYVEAFCRPAAARNIAAGNSSPLAW